MQLPIDYKRKPYETETGRLRFRDRKNKRLPNNLRSKTTFKKIKRRRSLLLIHPQKKKIFKTPVKKR